MTSRTGQGMTDQISYLREMTVYIVNRLRYKHDWRPSIYFDERRERFNISSEPLPYSYLGVYAEEKVAEIPANIKRVVLYGLCPMNSFLGDILSGLQPLYCRFAFEIAKKLPSWRMKNRLYRHFGASIADPPPIIAPNSFLDYIHPKLIRIGGM